MLTVYGLVPQPPNGEISLEALFVAPTRRLGCDKRVDRVAVYRSKWVRKREKKIQREVLKGRFIDDNSNFFTSTSGRTARTMGTSSFSVPGAGAGAVILSHSSQVHRPSLEPPRLGPVLGTKVGGDANVDVIRFVPFQRRRATPFRLPSSPSPRRPPRRTASAPAPSPLARMVILLVRRVVPA